MKTTEKPIIVEQTFDTAIEKVWAAITNLNKMKQWFFPMIPAFDPVVGFKTQFTVQVEDRVYPHIWRLTEVKPPHKITYDWSYEGYAGRGLVTFELFEQDKQTLLRLTNMVVEDFQDGIPEFKRESGVEGWTYLIQTSLKGFLAGNKG